MNLFGNCGCGGNKGLFNFNKCCDGDNGCGCDLLTIIIILLLLTNCCGCNIDWCTIIVVYLLISCCGCGHNDNQHC